MPDFIALQCFMCSTMQVKQQKKSSNKWSCVVCNEKQSVRKVFAKSTAAKDIRLFVQNFNMSRHLSDQKQQFAFEEELHASNSPRNEPEATKKKRTDWTEYIDDGNEELSGKNLRDENLTQGDEFDPKIVLEMPKSLFKKPKVKNYTSNKQGSTEKLLKPLFPSRRSNLNQRHTKDHDKAISQSMNEFKQTTNSVQQTTKETDKAVHIAEEEKSYASRLAKGQVSKWSSFIEEEEEEDNSYYNLQRGNSSDHGDQDKDNVVVSLINDQRVEDDIHPDFL
ncbi:uncharacterized protein LOC127257393 [Andrographis paniculata]|uniref:uncharacterized protein LOC127257393 n=1 Tax=Andrographis paniculata TaxID=175694 RepID=UPI0021E840AA|nr:uncharacterized protein LOC127257393 [Andrographis paniculata]